MRLSLLSLLLVTAVTPALAADPDPEPQSEAREAPAPRFERAPRAEREAPRERPERFERPERMERPEPALRAERFERPDPAERPARFDPPAPAPVRDVARAAIADTGSGDWSRRAERREAPRPSATSESASGWRERTGERRIRNRDVPPAAGSPVFGSAIPDAGSVTTPRREVSAQDVAAGSLRGRIAAEGLRRDRIERDRRDRDSWNRDSWNRDWRQDRRYDWRRHRDRDRSRFHVGIYIDPFGWGYRDWELGWQLPSRFYSAGYWINDPWSYRLPPVSGPYRWVRYYDDVLLVDLRTGRVLDRIRNFFW